MSQEGTVSDGKNPPPGPKPFAGGNDCPIYIMPATFSFKIGEKEEIEIGKGICIPALEITDSRAMVPGQHVEFDLKWQAVGDKELLVATNVKLKLQSTTSSN